MSVDVRTRVDGPTPPVDPAAFFGHELPRALEANGALLETPVRALAPPPLSLEVEGATWHLSADDGRVVVRRGASVSHALDSPMVSVRLGVDQLGDLVHDQATPMGWFSSGQLALEGRLEDLLDWWLVIRGALDGTARHVTGAPVFRASDGTPLDLARSFAWTDPDEDMARFLEQ
ncbi:MAG TPA: SCP2 sterol-binding domain-containing protein, partial [Acidimicrobiales bacterium]|nr:SCP2 sterol-binding domain-containing protein [Acidimicrobiales bacterium]